MQHKRMLMWDSPLYAVNMFYYYWLIKKLLQPMVGNLNRDRERVDGTVSVHIVERLVTAMRKVIKAGPAS